MTTNKAHFEILGIPVRVHWSLVVFLVLAAFLFSVGTGFVGLLTTIFLLAFVFGFVLLHELGHSVVARYHGVAVRGITLFPLGGIASLASMPREPYKEIQIALAGPLVNFFLAALFSLAYFIVPGAFLAALVQLNLILALFNLLPGFPLDGGRVLRAFLARRRSYYDATRIAVRVGQAVAVGLGVFGLVAFQPVLVAIAVFLYLAARTELLNARLSTDRFLDPFRRSEPRLRTWARWDSRWEPETRRERGPRVFVSLEDARRGFWG